MGYKMQTSYPRVLIISAVPISTKSATGITLMNLFDGWPSGSVAQIYDDESVPEGLAANNYRRFSNANVPLVNYVKIFLKIIFGKKSSINNKPSSAQKNTVSGISRSSNILGAFSDIVPIRVPDDIINWVRDFKPDLIYSVLGNVRVTNVVLDVSKRLGLPVVIHFMDDWPTTTYAESRFLWVPRKVLKWRLRSMLSQAAVRFTICDDMSSEYKRRYGGSFSSFMNCVEVVNLNASVSCLESNYVRFGYFGGLHLNRWRSLLNVAKALQVQKNQGKEICLEIYAPIKDINEYGELFKPFSVVRVMDTLSASEVGGMLQCMDVLVHVESFDYFDSLYTRLSVSTKIPQYMASAKPILVHGPANISSVNYVSRSCAGVAVTTDGDVDGIVAAAHMLINDPQLRQQLGENGRSVAMSKHNAFVVRRSFREALLNAVRV